jgi:hypothetical protein
MGILLNEIEKRFGAVRAFDGRLACWCGSVCWDLRDLARLTKSSVWEIAQEMPESGTQKRGRRSAAVSDEKELPDFENNA